MAIAAGALDLFNSLKKNGYLSTPSNVMEIGAQQLGSSLLASPSKLEELGLLFAAKGTFPPGLPEQSQTNCGEEVPLDAPFARGFYEWLGFRYSAIDVDGSQDSIPLDLNYDDVPEEDRGKYQLVTNFGTTEHVANQLNAFKIVHDLTDRAGLMIHTIPIQGHFNHGLINYNPKFFWMLARSNGYKWIHHDLHFEKTQRALPQNIIDLTVPFSPDINQRTRDYQCSDCGATMILQKQFDMPFVAPLDVATGSATKISAMRKRYWTVYESNAFDRLVESRNDR